MSAKTIITRCRPLIVTMLLGAITSASAAQYSWPTFDKAPGLQFNGNAKVIGDESDEGTGVIRLTQPSTRKKGSVFTTFGVDDTGFHTAFAFRVRDSGGAQTDCRGKKGGEGLAFVMQATSPDALGYGGGGLGYDGIPDSLAIEFDTFCNEEYADLSSNHIGVVAAGVELASAAIPRDLDDSDVRYVWIDYDGTRLEVRMSGKADRPGDPDLSYVVDVPSIVGGPVCCVGFTASTGDGVVAKHLILSWDYLELPSFETPTATELQRSAVVRPVCRDRVGTSSSTRSLAR